MRHRVFGRKLGRKTAHRLMMFRNMVTSLLDKERIRTTLPRAKELRRFAERMITLGKRETLHARRQALSFIQDPAVVAKLFETLEARYPYGRYAQQAILEGAYANYRAGETALGVTPKAALIAPLVPVAVAVSV